MRGFVHFVREQGIVGFAAGFILGSSITKVVTAFVVDIVNPVLSIVTGAAGNLRDAYLQVGPIQLRWGDFVSTLIDFMVLALVVYFGVKLLGLERLDRKKNPS